jgi:hypothetical protein
MKITSNADNERLQAKLESLELPEVQLPKRQHRLRETLLASACFEKDVAFLPLHRKITANIRPVAWKLAASFAVLFLILGTHRTFLTAPQAVASLAMQVNPAVTMTISARNNVIKAEGLDEQGQALLAGVDLTGREVPQALRIIADAMREAGLLGPERRILLALHPANDRLGAADLAALSGNVRQTLDEYLAEHGLSLKVVSSELTAEFSVAANKAGLMPADYVDLVAAVGSPLAMQVLNLLKELGLNPARYKEELPGISEAIIDLIEEQGLSKDEALARIKAAVKSDPTLENFDELLETPETETEESNESGSPENDKSERPERDTEPDAQYKDLDEKAGPKNLERDKSKPDTAGEDADEVKEVEESPYELQKPADGSYRE